MSKKSPDEILGLEYDWLAVDADTRVAVFSTAGGGYAPPGFLEDTDLHETALDAIRALPIVGKPLEIGSNGATTFWLDLAARGLYAYDSDYYGKPYQMVAAPTAVILLRDLPDVVRLAVQNLHLRHLSFHDHKVLAGSQLSPLD